MKSLAPLKRAAFVAAITAGLTGNAHAVLQFWKTDGSSGTWTGANWSAAPSATGGTAWTTSNTARFTANTGALTFASTNVNGVTVDPGVIAAITTIGGTWSTTGTNMPVDVGAGGIFDMAGEAVSTAAGVGFTKNGTGIFKTSGSAYLGGFTLNSGTIIVGGINAMGNGALTINGGTIAANANRAITGITGVTVNNNFTMGAVTTLVPSGNATATATISMTAPVNLTTGIRTITIGGNANGYTFSGAVTNGGLIIDATGGATGRIILLSPSSTYAGGTTIKTGAILSTNAISSTGVGPVTSGPLGVGTLTLDGGNYIPSSGASNTIGNAITLNSPSSNRITNSTTSGIGTTLSGNVTGAGGFTKGGGGVLILTGANNYSGPTIVESGVLAFAKTQSFYNNTPASWIDTNFRVDADAAMVFAVGGAGEFSFSDFLNLATVGTASGGFKDLSSIGIDTTNGGDQTISTVFANNNSGANKLGLVKSGTNTLFLTAANTHSGPTTVAGGTLNLSNQLALQSSTLTTSSVAGNTVFDQSVGGNAFTVGGLAGTGNLALLNNAGSPASIALTVGNNNVDAVYSAALSGAGSLIKVGTAIQTLSAASNYSGGTTINAGTLAINQASAIGTGPLTLNTGAKFDNTTGANITLSTNNAQNWNGNFTFTGTRALNLGTGAVTMAGNTEIAIPGLDASNNGLTVGGVISGAGLSITKSGQGRVTLSGQSTFSGGVKVTGGTVHAGEQSSNLGSGTGPLGTGTLELSGGRLIGSSTNATVSTIENAIQLIGSAASNTITNNGTLTLPGVISGTGGFSKTGNGTLILKNENTFSGDTIAAEPSVAPQALNLSHELALKNSTLVTSSTGGVIAFDASVLSNSFTLGGLSGDRNLSLTNTASTPITLTVGNNNSNTIYTGALSGGGSLVKIGTGKTTLGGASNYTGTTTVNNGILLINGSHTGGGTYTVNTGGTLGGTGAIAANVNVGGTLAPGASIGTLNIGASVSLTSGTFDWEFSGGPPPGTNAPIGADVMNVAGTLSIASAVSLVGANFGTAVITGTKFVAISYLTAGAPGTFGGMPDDSYVIVGGKQWLINYDDTSFAGAANFGQALYGNAVTLTAVPELSSFVTVALGGIFAIGAVRLGKRLGLAFKV